MKFVDLYKYENDNGSFSITTEQRRISDVPYEKRLIADNGFYLKKGDKNITVIDVKIEDVDNWVEVEAELTEYEQIIDILTGGEG